MSRPAVALAFALMLGACDDDEPARSAATATNVVAATGTGVPDELAGLWRTTIDRSRIEDPPGELTRERSVWTLKFLGTGGDDNGPSLFVSNAQVGEIVHSISLAGAEITLHSEAGCRKFTYRSSGTESIRILTSERDRGCPSTMISSVLRSHWRRVESAPSRRG